MKGAVLGAVAIGSPIVAMMIGWHWWAMPSVENRPPRPPATAPAIAVRPRPIPRRVLTIRPAAGAASRPSSPLEAGQALHHAAATASQWAGFWQELVHGRDDGPYRAEYELLFQQRYDKALSAFDRALARTPNDPDALLGKAMALSGLQRHEDARPLLEHVIERRPDHVVARFNYAVALALLGAPADAQREFQTVLQLEPEHVGAQFNLAVLHQAAGRHREALELWRRLTRPRPLAAMSVGASAATATQPAMQAAGGLAFRRSLSPTQLAEAWFHRGEVAQTLFLSEEAEACFLQVLNLDPEDARAWCNLGIARAGWGRRSEAVEALEKALHHDPRLLPAVNQLAFIHAAGFRDTQAPESRRKALECCERSLRLHPDQHNIEALRDSLLQRGGEAVALKDAGQAP